jgi:hypothetical protein
MVIVAVTVRVGVPVGAGVTNIVAVAVQLGLTVGVGKGPEQLKTVTASI